MGVSEFHRNRKSYSFCLFLTEFIAQLGVRIGIGGSGHGRKGCKDCKGAD